MDIFVTLLYSINWIFTICINLTKLINKLNSHITRVERYKKILGNSTKKKIFFYKKVFHNSMATIN